MPKPEELGFDTGQIVEEISGKVESFESKFSDRLSAISDFWNTYKGHTNEARVAVPVERDRSGFTRTFVHETARAVDNLATTRYRMMMAQDPPFETLSQRGDVPEETLWKIQARQAFQMERSSYKRNLRKALTSLELVGTVVVEEPWMQWPAGPNPVWEGTGFIPRPMNQVFFSPNALSIDLADYMGTLDIISSYGLRRLSESDSNGEAWIPEFVQESLSDKADDDSTPKAVRSRLTQAGYKDFKGNKELLLYYGPLESQNSFEEWVVGIVNRKYLVRFHKPVLPMRPFRIAHVSEIEQEPFSIGVGAKTAKLQKMLNANRSRIFDLILFSLYSMFKMGRYSGADPRDMRIKPFNVIVMDDIAGLEPIRPDISAAQYGLKLEELLKEEFRSLTGASQNLQAIVTEATATESSIVQNEVMRRISVDTEIMAEELLRNHLYYSHKQDLLFLDKPLWLKITGSEKPQMVDPSEIAHEVDFRIKITTDKDFRPNRVRRMIELIQVLTSVRNVMPPEAQANVSAQITELIREAVLAFGIGPIRSLPQIQSAIPPPNVQAGGAAAVLAGLLSKENAMQGEPAPLNGFAPNMRVGL